MRSVEIRLGGKGYTIHELPVRKNAAWRKELQAHFGELVALLSQMPNTKINDLSDLGALINGLSAKLLGSIDTITGLVTAYAPELGGKQLELAYESEILEAFAKILTLAFPFGVWGDKARPMIQEMMRLSASKNTTTS